MAVQMGEIVKRYDTQYELRNPDIKAIFGVSNSKASMIKKEVIKEQLAQGVPQVDEKAVNFDFLLQYYGIDIKKLKERVKKK